MDSIEISSPSSPLPGVNDSDITQGSKSDGAASEVGSGELKDLFDVEDNYNIEKEGSTSGLTLPRLKDSMTPWRTFEKPPIAATKSRRGRSNTSLDVLSPLNSRPATRNSLFSTDGAYTATSFSASSESEYLQKQLTTYKLKVRALLELIKQVNYGGEGLENNESFYRKLLSTIAHNENVEELNNRLHEIEASCDAKSKSIADLRGQLAVLDKQLTQTKEEHAETLEYANEYIGLNEQVTTRIDGMLTLLLDNLDLPVEERIGLEGAKTASSEFAMAKMNALAIALEKILDDLKRKPEPHQRLEQSKEPTESIAAVANSTGLEPLAIEVFDERNQSVNESAIDTRFELAIEDMHEQYENFVKGIQKKLDRSAELERVLSVKLARQAEILQLIELESRNKHQEGGGGSRRCNSLVINMDEPGKHSSADLSKSYQDHVDSLNGLVHILKTAVADKTEELQKLEEKVRDQEQLRKSEQRSKQDLQSLKELSKQKENTWEEFTSNLEQSIEHFQVEKEALLKENDQLNQSVEFLKKENLNLEDALHTAIRKSEIYNEQRSRLAHEHKIMTDELVDLKDENSALHKLTFKVEAISNTVHKQESEFQKFQGHLLLHLDNVFKTLSKILQKKSVDQSKHKLQVLYQTNGLSQMKIMQPKLESLYNFMETALESIVESYMLVILTEKDKPHSSKSHEKQMQLRIDELERKWVSERERRKLDSNAAETQINKLETENEALREKLYNMTIR